MDLFVVTLALGHSGGSAACRTRSDVALAPHQHRRGSMGPFVGRPCLAVAAVSLAPAWLTFAAGNPLRHSTAISRSARLAFSVGANFTLAGVVAGLVLVVSTTVQNPDGA